MLIKKINGITLSNYLDAGLYFVDPSSDVTFNFPTGRQYKMFERIGTTFYASSITTNNISSYDFYYSSTGLGNTSSWSILQVPGTLSQGSAVYLEATASSTASLSQIVLSSDLMYGLSFSSKDYFYPRTGEFFSASVLISDEYLETNVGVAETLTPAGTVASDIRSNIRYSTPVYGNWELIIEPDRPMSGNSNYFGLNNRTSADNNTLTPGARITYGIGKNASEYNILETNVNKLTVADYQTAYTWFRIVGSASGNVGYVYYYRGNGDMELNLSATWSLIYSSTVTYSLTTLFYQDMLFSVARFGIYKPCRLKQN